MSRSSEPSFLKEFYTYLSSNKKWWLIPIIMIILCFAVLAVVAELAPAVSPFIYTLF